MKHLYFVQLDGLELVFIADSELDESGVRERLKNIDPIHEGGRCRVNSMTIHDDLHEPTDISSSELRLTFWF